MAVLAMFAVSCDNDDEWEDMIPETDDDPTMVQLENYIFRPGVMPATDENVQQLRVPEGFTVSKFAENLGNPRILVVSSTGNIYVSDRMAGVVRMLQDTDGDGTADNDQVVANIEEAHGLAIHNGRMYIAAIREMYRADMNMDGTLGQPQLLADTLPDAGQHPNRTMSFGPDGQMYLSIGSTCNACDEPNPLHATIVQANDDATDMQIYAEGLRNTIGFGWHPETGEMWGVDHGIDWLGDDEQKEEVNQIIEGNHYGWPFIYDEGKYNPKLHPPGDTSYQEFLQLTTLPEQLYTAHSAPMQMAFYTGNQFPAEYQNDAFVAMRGSWNRSTPVGYKVVRLRFDNAGQPVGFDDFLTGFLINNGRHHFARLVGVAVHTDGSLLVSDDTNGVIYRVAHQ
ncbi:PQQ-dependent sugar dehydrogenase [Pontibacter diazotrophicus]|nr:PQQ-dependent sugar dehydrogenase [Pontibacter diazotrophicus]